MPAEVEEPSAEVDEPTAEVDEPLAEVAESPADVAEPPADVDGSLPFSGGSSREVCVVAVAVSDSEATINSMTCGSRSSCFFFKKKRYYLKKI